MYGTSKIVQDMSDNRFCFAIPHCLCGGEIHSISGYTLFSSQGPHYINHEPSLHGASHDHFL